MTEPAMSQLGRELAANEVPSMPPSPAEHMPPVPDPMNVIEPLLTSLSELHKVLNQTAQTVWDVKCTLLGLDITVTVPEPLRAPDDKHRKKDEPQPDPEPESEDSE